eukprot:393280_1
MKFNGLCSPVRIKRKRFPTQICMAQLKIPSGSNHSICDEYEATMFINDDKYKQKEVENLRLHHQRAWLARHTSDATLLSLRSMTNMQRKSFRALFDILDPHQSG